MYTALILMVLVTGIAVVAIGSALRKTISLFRGNEQQASIENPAKGKTNEKEKNQKKEAQDVKKEPEQKATPQMDEQMAAMFEQQTQQGISEHFWMKEEDVSFSSKKIADSCVEACSITYLEYNNRMLADENFTGFNLGVLEDKKIALTYNHQVIAMLSKESKDVTLMQNGKEVTCKVTFYRTNTFPPAITPKTDLRQIDTMMGCINSLRALEGDPASVQSAMMGYFTGSANISELKRNIDSKIQVKETKTMKEEQRQTESARKYHTPTPKR